MHNIILPKLASMFFPWAPCQYPCPLFYSSLHAAPPSMETGSALQTILYLAACAAAILARVGMETGFVNVHLGSPFFASASSVGPYPPRIRPDFAMR